MEKFQEAKELAIKHIKAADHILTQTYPSLRDPKLLVAALDNTYLAFDEAMSAILHYKRHINKIPPFHESFSTKLEIIKKYVNTDGDDQAIKNKIGTGITAGITKEHIIAAKTIYEIINAHKESAVEFSRKDAFIITTDNYNLQKITPEKLKSFIKEAKTLITAMEIILREHERIFN